MNRLALYKILFLTTAFLLYCYNLTQTMFPFAIYVIHTPNKNTVNDVKEQLGEIKKFRFLLNSNACNSCSDSFLLIITVFSALENYKERNAIRKSWGTHSKCTKTVFLFGTTENRTIIDNILRENYLHADIVQGNFIDTYRNLTYKHVMGLKWVSKYCAKAKYVIKIDDDVTILIGELRDQLRLDPWGSRGLMACALLHNVSVLRNHSTWTVPKQEFAGDRYPDYCNGPLVIYSKDVVPRLLEESTKVPFFWIDDVYVTGILAQRIGVKPLNVVGLFAMFTSETILLDPYAAALNKSTVDAYMMYKHWKKVGKIANMNKPRSHKSFKISDSNEYRQGN